MSDYYQQQLTMYLMRREQRKQAQSDDEENSGGPAVEQKRALLARLQRRIADDQVQTERERLLRAFLRVGDDLERALRAAEADPGAILEGVRLIHQSFMLVLQQHDVLPIDAQGQAFDPNRHEAVTMTPAPAGAEGEPRVAEVLETGYVLGDRLLRPAKVVVQR